VLTSPFTPMLFMGEEWGASTPWQFFTSHTDPEIGPGDGEGRKGEFAEHGWDADEVPDPQDPETFTRSEGSTGRSSARSRTTRSAVHRPCWPARPTPTCRPRPGAVAGRLGRRRPLAGRAPRLAAVVATSPRARGVDLDGRPRRAVRTRELPRSTAPGTLPAESAAVLTT
jgi:maltooligosyltrehalose trehalohydrolase